MPNDPQHIIVHTAAFEGAASIDDIDRWHRRRGVICRPSYAAEPV